MRKLPRHRHSPTHVLCGSEMILGSQNACDSIEVFMALTDENLEKVMGIEVSLLNSFLN